MVDAEMAVSIAYRGCSAAMAISFLEQVVVQDRAFGFLGPFSPAASRVLGRALVAKTGVLRIHLLVGVLASTLAAFIGPLNRTGALVGLLVLICVWSSKRRRVTASDGAEQMAILTLASTCLVTIPGIDESLLMLAVWFIGCQTILSYATAGIAKSVSPVWRDGHALGLIMGSECYGQPWAGSILESYPTVSRWLTRGVVAFECAFPLVLVAPPQFTWLMLLIGFLFHLGCAVTMGLNSFLLVFPATYPCVIVITSSTSPF